jgi:O-antigen/teichoic acid export membrane protein
VIFTIYAPELFSFVFGEKWLVAGQFAQIMIPAIALRFIVSTLSSTLGATKNNKIGAIWKIIYFVSTILVLSIYAPVMRQIPKTVESLSLGLSGET